MKIDITKKIIQFKNKINELAETGWNEVNTTNFIENTLKRKPIKKGFGGHQVGLIYKIGQGKNTILLRADIDALKTKNSVKHICGHSSHTSALMGTFLDTVAIQDTLSKQNKAVYFLFQPAEETFPSGAKSFINESKDLLPGIKYAFATHVLPLMPLNNLGLRKGAVFSRGDYMEFEIFGKMVHVKHTPFGKDALEAASYLILYIKHLQKRFINSIRINVGVINGGKQSNTVADYAVLKSDFRMIAEKYQKIIKEALIKKIKKIEMKVGVTIKLHYYPGFPFVINDSKLTSELTAYFKKESTFNLISSPELLTFGCEDFTFISQKIPSVYAFIGTGDRVNTHEENCTISDAGTINVYKYFSCIIDWWLKFKS